MQANVTFRNVMILHKWINPIFEISIHWTLCVHSSMCVHVGVLGSVDSVKINNNVFS